MRHVMTALTAALAGLMSAQQMPTIRVPVRLVNLPTLVFSNEDRLLTGLQLADFHILDNGRVQSASLDPSVAPVSVVLAIQANLEVREYIHFIAKVGSAIEALLVGESGEAAVVTYGNEVMVAKPFEDGDVQKTLKKISAGGKPARMIDAGVKSVALLAERPGSRSRVKRSDPTDRSESAPHGRRVLLPSEFLLVFSSGISGGASSVRRSDAFDRTHEHN